MFTITTKLLGYLSGGLGAAALAASAFAGLQTHRLNNAQDDIAGLQQTVKAEASKADLAITAANERGEALRARDALIAQQSGSIDAMALAAQQDRSVYTAGIAKADTGAKTHEARAAEIIALPAPAAGERCEAARTLIQQELLNVR